jgi:transposase
MRISMVLLTPINEQKQFISKGLQKELVGSCKKTVSACRLEVDQTDMAIDLVIRDNERLNRLFQIITSVPNVGRVTAIQIILSTNAFRDITNPRKFACYAGVAPFRRESGLFKGKASVSHIANKKVKALLHICAVTAIRADQPFRAYYERKIAEGKAKMAVINAIRYKLILRIFACLNQDRLYDPEYNQQCF